MANYTNRHVQNCREPIDGSEGTERRTEEYINLVFPDFTLVPEFEQEPDLFGSKYIKRESKSSVDRQAQAVVDRIFKSEPTGAICNYLVAFSTQQLCDADGRL